MEIGRQVDAFCDATGRRPDFIDGHQHVHVLPGIRDAVIGEAVRRGWKGKVWVRDPADRVAAIVQRPSAPKAAFVSWLSRPFRAMAADRGFAMNRGFSGFSDFAPDGDAAAAMARYFDAVGEAPLVMCHPGLATTDPTDEIGSARPIEYRYVASPAFGELLSSRDIRLVGRPAGRNAA